MSARRQINKILKKFGYEIIYSNPAVVENDSKFDFNFDYLLTKSIENKPDDFFFIQIGANDFVSRKDDLFDYVRDYENISGLLVEPQPDLQNKLSELQNNYPKLKIINKAIHNEQPTATLYRLKFDNVKNLDLLPHWAKTNGIASFYYDHVLSHAKKINLDASSIEEIAIDCISLNNLLEEHNHAPDLLKIDTEGYDYHILNEIDFDKYKPGIIRFENLHMKRENHSQLIRKMKHYGYKFFADKNDTTAFL